MNSITSPAPAALIREHFEKDGGGPVVSLRRRYRASDVEGLQVTVDDRVVALVTFAVHKNGAEIVTLDAMTPGKGYGRIALTAALDELLRRGVFHVWLYTTNDNLAAQHVYLALGWRLVRVHLDAMDRVRSLKPDVPLIGLNGLPLTDMWMFEKFLFPTDDEGIQ